MKEHKMEIKALVIHTPLHFDSCVVLGSSLVFLLCFLLLLFFLSFCVPSQSELSNNKIIFWSEPRRHRKFCNFLGS